MANQPKLRQTSTPYTLIALAADPKQPTGDADQYRYQAKAFTQANLKHMGMLNLQRAVQGRAVYLYDHADLPDQRYYYRKVNLAELPDLTATAVPTTPNPRHRKQRYTLTSSRFTFSPAGTLNAATAYLQVDYTPRVQHTARAHRKVTHQLKPKAHVGRLIRTSAPTFKEVQAQASPTEHLTTGINLGGKNQRLATLWEYAEENPHYRSRSPRTWKNLKCRHQYQKHDR